MVNTELSQFLDRALSSFQGQGLDDVSEQIKTGLILKYQEPLVEDTSAALGMSLDKEFVRSWFAQLLLCIGTHSCCKCVGEHIASYTACEPDATLEAQQQDWKQ